jgi:mRNA-degrading endonuclease RelE of RelBE toxin-antitoxin system
LPRDITYSEDSEEHLRALSARDRKIVLSKVVEQLTHQSTVETKNRKKMRPNPIAPWELRIGNLRAYYDPDRDEASVVVVAIGIKRGNKVFIGGEEVLELEL